MQVEIRSNVCHFVFFLELLVTSWAVWLTFFFFFFVQPLQSCRPSWAAQILLAFSWLLVMFHRYLQPAAAESMGCSRYWVVLVQRDPVERYKLRFVHRLPEMCCVCFSEADPVHWRLTFVAVHFSRSAVAVWEAEPGTAARCRVNPCAPWLLGMLHLASWKKDKNHLRVVFSLLPMVLSILGFAYWCMFLIYPDLVFLGHLWYPKWSVAEVMSISVSEAKDFLCRASRRTPAVTQPLWLVSCVPTRA